MAQYIRGLLNSQSQVKLLDVLSDGSKVLAQIQQLRPDVVLVDALLQGRVKGLPLAEQIRDVRPRRPGHRPDRPPEPGRDRPGQGHPRRPRDAVLGLRPDEPDQRRPQGLRDRSRRPARRGSTRSSPRRAASARRRSRSTSRSPLGQPGQRTVLIDGSLQFGDLRGAPQGAGRRAVDPRPADRPGRRIRPPGRPLARPVGDRHPARPAAGRDGRDGHRPRRRQGPVAPAPGLRLDRDRHVVGPQRHQPLVPRPVATRSSRSSRTTRRRSTTRSRSPTRSG